MPVPRTLTRRVVLPACFVGAVLAACGSDSAEAPGVTPAADDAGAPTHEDAQAPLTDGGAQAPDAGGFTSCAALAGRPEVRFCDDFEDGDLTNDWTVATGVPANRTTLDLALEARSGQYAFYAATEAAAQDVPTSANLRKTVPGAFTRASLSFAIRMPRTDVGKGALAVATLDVAPSHFFTLHLRDVLLDVPGADLEESRVTGSLRRPLSAALPVDRWTRVAIDLDLAAGRAEVRFDGVTVLAGAEIAKEPGTEANVRVGAVYVVGPTPKVEVLIDDVLLETW